MASAPKVVPVADDDYARQKRELEARCVTAEVTGAMPIRDAVSRESIQPGGIVRLDPGTEDPQRIMLGHLVSTGAVKLLPAQTAQPGSGTEG